MQLLGSVVLGVGVWLAADKASFIALLKMVENEHIEVSEIVTWDVDCLKYFDLRIVPLFIFFVPFISYRI